MHTWSLSPHPGPPGKPFRICHLGPILPYESLSSPPVHPHPGQTLHQVYHPGESLQ
ncbi:hypothetical protein JB92DRAFT_3006481 [Gautieria morchelliformis]|nr:hypothetical protein JB92DRAFT_3006481 [Gautieria morchelliformis]